MFGCYVGWCVVDFVVWFVDWLGVVVFGDVEIGDFGLLLVVG